MNSVIENIRNRRSIRKYEDKAIPKDVIAEIISAGRYAPSSHNSQPWRFIVITDKNKIKEMSERVKLQFKRMMILGKIAGIFNSKIKSEIESAKKRLGEQDLFFYNAPVIVLICSKPGKFALVDCACAAENMMLAARSVGVGSCWIGFADMVINKNRKFMDSLGVPKKHKIMAHLVFGYPLKFPGSAMERKAEADVINWI